MAKLIISVKYHNIAVNANASTESAVLNVANVINTGINNAKDLISTDPDNDLKLGSDNKLMVATDELNTSFNYASSVSTFWSI